MTTRRLRRFMITFGELRRVSLQLALDVAAVERVYAIDCLIKGVFDRERLHNSLALRGASALSKAYFRDYPPSEDIDFVHYPTLPEETLISELGAAAEIAAASCGIKYALYSFAGSEARFEFTGPLGRRSAAQPRLPFRFHPTPLRREAFEGSLLHPFSERIEATVRAVSLEELAAERIALLGARPRARDLFDLWFILTHPHDGLDRAATLILAQSIANEKGRVLQSEIESQYAAVLERAWNNSLKSVRNAPSFAQVQGDLKAELAKILLT